MGRVEKTVFISYRRTNTPWALAIYQNLTAHGYDVFFDYETIASGDFEQVILGNIRARAHFLVILTPSALERCAEPGDWLRREIETALDEKRNIVPIFLEGFDFSSSSISKYLTGKLAYLRKYNGQNIPTGFFDAAMEKIRNRFLNTTLDAVLHPVSEAIQDVVNKQKESANNATQVNEQELTAQAWLEQGTKHYFGTTLTDTMRRNTESDMEMLHTAIASLWLWTQREDVKPENLAVKYWQVSRVYTLIKQPHNARTYGLLSLKYASDLDPLFRAYAYETLARAEMQVGNRIIMLVYLEKAREMAKLVENIEDKQRLLQELETIG